MKRSQLNALIDQTHQFFKEMNFHVPAWTRWAPSDWKGKGAICREIVDNMLGWDLTDFGSGDFPRRGLIMLTLRNGNMKKKEYRKSYGEKALIVQEGQLTPMHYHWSKMEDIINRGGGNLVVQVYRRAPDERLSQDDVTFSMDGIRHTARAGTNVVLEPGSSITLEPEVYHLFYGEHGKGTILVGEVSTVNDDTCDNRFLEPLPRFPELEEDEPPRYLLAFEYEQYL
jgi:D-lyxose ketol-isomerase